MRTRFGMTRDLRTLLGFSLLELLIVMAITLVVGAMAAPRFTTMVSNYRLKSSASSVAGILQQTRMSAVRLNRAVQATSTMNSGLQQLYVDLNANGQVNSGEPTVIMPKKITFQSTGAPADATANLASVPTTFYTTPPQFNARGLPCVVVGATCSNVDGANKLVGYVYYLKSDGMFGQTQWAAVTVTPAGRIKTWMYTGSKFQ